MKKNALVFMLVFSLSALAGGRPLDFKQSVEEFSSNDHLTKMFAQNVEQRAARLFDLVEKSISQGEKVAMKETFAKQGVIGIMDKIEWDFLIQRWQKKMQIKR
ncbi:MAG: hypothetical protein A2X86_07890 [Bdellovibrionales bacterium GWA2_49_15]|nr:MAG: hypothetical protein A2X86_07890 [Bdellovibrionales bacterium GWA2_49_15]HAZ11801.1 hypothetical protein [Bdellovibrionales bacterium]